MAGQVHAVYEYYAPENRGDATTPYDDARESDLPGTSARAAPHSIMRHSNSSLPLHALHEHPDTARG